MLARSQAGATARVLEAPPQPGAACERVGALSSPS